MGVLHNVFLYVDGNSAAFVLEDRLADEFWIWAQTTLQTPEQSPNGSQGYLRVRLQQLVHKIHVARRWHADEVSLEDLWKASQKDPHNGSFVQSKPR